MARRIRRSPVDFLVLATFDGLIAATVAVSLARRASPVRRAVVTGMFGAAMLDMDKPSWLFFGRSCFPKAVDRLHVRIQNEAPHRLPHEIVAGYSLVSLAEMLVHAER